MQKEIADWLAEASNIADLYSGCGALSLPLLATGRNILAVDLPGPSLQALQQAANQAGFGNQLQTQARDLEAAPLQADELSAFQAVIMDPPRSGASKQAAELARSSVPKIMMVSCNPHSFVRDAQLLVEAGYVFDWVKLIDQFDRASHSEVLAGFSWPEQMTGGGKSGILV
jgi:23S rRNA (uracil1939-C5)-methyltransferase